MACPEHAGARPVRSSGNTGKGSVIRAGYTEVPPRRTCCPHAAWRGARPWPLKGHAAPPPMPARWGSAP